MTATDADTARFVDQRIHLNGVTWADYERLLAMRGESAAVRITYLKGAVELMSPSTQHEWIKKTIARLVEAYADELCLDLIGFGSWTVKQEARERGLEPDECYVLGTEEQARPDLAIEVVWTSGGLDKLEVYRGLGVPEVWYWRDGRIEVYVLRGERYEVATGSELMADLDLGQLARFVEHPNQARAVREYRAALRARLGLG